MKRIGLLTSGGDSPGMNPTIRAVVHEAINQGIEVYGFRRGYVGLMDGDHIKMDLKTVGGIIKQGGTILLTARCEEFKSEQGIKAALKTIEKEGIEGLIVIGGDGSLRGGLDLCEAGVPVIGIPGSIDNDIYGTDMAIGVDTALNNIIGVVDKIKDTASSHERTFIIEVMGRNSGYLAISSAIASGAEAVIVPEVEYDLEIICQRLKEGYKRGKTNSLVIVAEGADTAYGVARHLKKIGQIETKITVLGHLQRGGSPTCFDRLLGSRLGKEAVEFLLKGESGKMVGTVKRDTELTDLRIVTKKKREIDQTYIELAEKLSK
ncbi:MAG: 6-phosphofructokinase [candidate division Zixibacteria bacterium]|nr:6-phosphofructokinase [candidate division Zixibacteria bacterium]